MSRVGNTGNEAVRYSSLANLSRCPLNVPFVRPRLVLTVTLLPWRLHISEVLHTCIPLNYVALPTPHTLTTRL